MPVWLVCYGEYSNWGIVGVFSSAALAQQCIDSDPNDYYLYGDGPLTLDLDRITPDKRTSTTPIAL